MSPHITEWLRPWKLATLAIGIGLLYLGERIWPAPDWTPSTIWAMALVTYLTAGWSMRVLIERRWRDLPLALFWGWLAVDGIYCAALWLSGDGHAIGLMREANAPASASLFMGYGMVLMFNGPLRAIPQAWRSLRAA